MRVLANIVPGARWRPGRPVHEQGEVIREHLAFMQAAFYAGSLLLGGPMATGMSGVAVLDVPDLEAAEAFASADPAVAAEVLVYEVEEVVPIFEALSASRRAAAGRSLDEDARS